MLSKLFSKTKHRNSGILILIILVLQFTYVNFVGQKDQLTVSSLPPILDLDTYNTEVIQKRQIKTPNVSPVSMSANLSCQIVSSQVKCTERLSGNEKLITPPQLPISLSSSSNFSCLIDKDAGVHCWNHSIKKQKVSFNRIPLANATVQVSSNNEEACALLKTGEVFCWSEKNGVFSHPQKKSLTDETVVSISSAKDHHCATSQSGNVMCWGGKYSSETAEISHIQLREKALRISSGPEQDCIITKRKRELICWDADYTDLAKAPNLENLHEVSLGSNLSCGLTFEGNVYCWNSKKIADIKLQMDASEVSTKLISMSSNETEICGLTDEQRLVCWNKIKQ